MSLILAGMAVLTVTGITIWFCIPREGNVHRLIASTEVARYIPVGLIAGVALGLSLIYVGFVR